MDIRIVEKTQRGAGQHNRISRLPFLSSLLFTLLFLSTGEAASKAPHLITQKGDWAAYSVPMKDGKTCYVVSQPKDQNPKNVRRDPSYFFVTIRPREKIRNQVSVTIGYPFANKKRASAEVKGKSFALFTKDDKAWIENLSEQDSLVSAMKKGATMTVRGISRRGTHTVDSYSLSGITQALQAAHNACR
ncbi:MAG: invasion associated locus B family protein [Alphaproteobacteria bacterium]|nr:invasion associated locus B family protein [Alphaproteobacteria bacterium]